MEMKWEWKKSPSSHTVPVKEDEGLNQVAKHVWHGGGFAVWHHEHGVASSFEEEGRS